LGFEFAAALSWRFAQEIYMPVPSVPAPFVDPGPSKDEFGLPSHWVQGMRDDIRVAVE
jgi:hypothetical protein